MPVQSIQLSKLNVFENQVEIHYLLDEKYSSLTRIVYHDINLFDLKNILSQKAFERLFAIIALLETFKFIPLFPCSVDLRALGIAICQDSCERIRSWIPNLYSQHLHENKRPDYKGPVYLTQNKTYQEVLSFPFAKSGPILCPNGGGKDSYLLMKLLNDKKVNFASFSSARSEYGKLFEQHKIQENNLLELEGLKAKHKVSVFDDITDWVWPSLAFPEVIGECSFGRPNQVGTPEMIFYALPIALTKGYQSIAMGWERSAEAVQAKNEVMNVNHQYLKSFAAEKAYQSFIKDFIDPDFRVFSLLRPYHDYKIFDLFCRQSPSILPFIHSCNIKKPWCKNCPKCAYVWIQMLAQLGPKKIKDLFDENLLDRESLLPTFEKLMGLQDENAFECVGSFDETRLAFKLAYKKAAKGKAMDLFEKKLLKICDQAWEEKMLKTFGSVYDEHAIPDFLINYEKTR